MTFIVQIVAGAVGAFKTALAVADRWGNEVGCCVWLFGFQLTFWVCVYCACERFKRKHER